MKNMKSLILLLTISTLFFSSCKTSNKISGNYTHRIECMYTELDGSITLKTWGREKKRAAALNQVMKEAINTVLFVTIRNGKPDCYKSPILNAPNIRENNAEYFNTFFKDGGDYKKFVSYKDLLNGEKQKINGRDGEVMLGFIISVMRSELKKQIITDGILNI